MAKCSYCEVFSGSASEVLAHLRSGCSTDPRWAAVAALRRAGQGQMADKIARRIMGVKGPEMPEATKEKLQVHYDENREEILQKRKEKRAARRRAIALTKRR